MSDLTFFDDPGIDGNYTRLRTDARPVERIAARKGAGKAGSWRRRIFDLAATAGTHGATSIEIAGLLAKQTPCPECDCEHRPPIPVNQIASRLQELRDWGYLMHRLDYDQTPMLRQTDGRTAEIHILTHKGLVEWSS
jgi:hypothetical protein